MIKNYLLIAVLTIISGFSVKTFSKNNLAAGDIAITLGAVAMPVVNPVANQGFCNGAPASVIFSGGSMSTVYNWTNTNTAIGLGASGSGNLNFMATNATAAPISGTITVTPVDGSLTGTPITFTITVANEPGITSVTGTSICTTGGVANLSAAANGIINWWNAPTGGVVVNTGTTFSPNLTTATTYYVDATTVPGPQTLLAMPGQSNTFPGNVRGYWFTAPTNFVITSLSVPTTASSAGQTIAVVKFNGNTPPPIFSGSTNAFTTEFLTRNNPAAGSIPCNIPVLAGEVIGILGYRGNVNSYAPGDYSTTIAGFPVQLERLGMQFQLTTNNPRDLWREFGATTSISRIEFEYSVSPNCVSTPRVPVAVTLSPAPVATATPAVQTICSGSAITTIALSSTETGTVYNWNRDNSGTVTGIASSGTGDISGALTNTTNSPVTVTFTITPTVSGCTGMPITATVLVNPTPNAIATPPSPTICNNSATSIALSSNVSGTTFSWVVQSTTGMVSGQSGGSGTSIAQTLVNSGATAATVTYRITPTGPGPTNCVGPTTDVTVTVAPSPAITCPNSFSVNSSTDGTGNCSGTASWTHPTIAAGPCGPIVLTRSIDGNTPVAVTPGGPASEVLPVGPHTVTYVVSDGNTPTPNTATCSFTVTVMDNESPSITCPGTQTLVLGANCTATLPNYTALATTGDNCGVQGVTQSPTAGTPVSGAGNMTVTLTVTDVNGLTNTCTFTVNKMDNTAPSITCPGTQTLVLGANCTAPLPNYTSLATTGDNCGVQGVTQSPTAGTPVSGAGNMTVTLTVTDINGLTNTCTFTVTKADQTPPTITCPATQILALGANCTATLPNYASLATTGDNCGIQSVTQSPAAGTNVSGTGSMIVTLMVADVNGQTNSCQFTVTKVDNTPPTVVCKNSTIILSAGGNYTLLAADVFNAAASSDNCSGVLTVTNISPATVNCSQANQTIPVTVTVQDAAGNSATCTAQITVQEGTGLPANWSSNNVGNANGSGGYKPCITNGQFTVTATGFSTSSADVLHLTSRQLCGNGEIITRVTGVNGSGWGGIMLRESLAQGSKMVALKTQNNGNIRRMIRATTNGAVNNLNYFNPLHNWLRLVRNGSSFVGYTSMDGINWTFAFSATVSMTGCVYAGVFAESINSNVVTTATFDNVQVIGGVPPLIQAPETPVAASSLSPVVYPNPTTGEVNIDLSGYADPVGTVRVFDVFGKLVKDVRLDGSSPFRMNLDNVDGVYFLSIEVAGEAPVTKRVVIAH